MDDENLHRLGERARSYFLPRVYDAEAARRLTSLLQAAVASMTAATDVPVALRSSGSRPSAGARSLRWDLNRPESYAANLRPGEGEYRLPKDGVWLIVPPRLRQLRSLSATVRNIFAT